ncbi:hypothetical protein ACWGJ2_08990 [Streptomyces sp. NPDC054796]
MTVDPTDPDTFDDVYEDEPEGPADPEAPEADAAEQQADLLRQHDVPITERGSDEVDPADAAEQARVVELNEDDYR